MPDDILEPTPSIPSTPLEPAKPRPITQSILLTIKKMLGIAEEYKAFDIDVITNINSVFFTLNQLNSAFPDFSIDSSGEETWQDYLGEGYSRLEAVKSYIYMRVRLLFDPPTNSFLVNSLEKQCQELEWRFSVQAVTKADQTAEATWHTPLPSNPNRVVEGESTIPEQMVEMSPERVREIFEQAGIPPEQVATFFASPQKKPQSLLDIFS